MPGGFLLPTGINKTCYMTNVKVNVIPLPHNGFIKHSKEQSK